MKKGEWHSWTWRHDQYELRGKTVGIVGGGAIGKGVMQRLQGWECTLIYSDPYRMPIEKEQELHCEYVDLDTLLERSDVVSLHCPLTNETRGMMGAEQFKKMKKNAIIVNVGRGPGRLGEGAPRPRGPAVQVREGHNDLPPRRGHPRDRHPLLQHRL